MIFLQVKYLGEWNMAKSSFSFSKYELVITYQSPYSKGTLIVDTNFYNKNINKFNKKFKDCEIISMIEREKEFESYL